jgi:hypothetical protein
MSNSSSRSKSPNSNSNVRRVKTDLQTSDNIFLQVNSRSRSSSPISPQKVSKRNCETPKISNNCIQRCFSLENYFIFSKETKNEKKLFSSHYNDSNSITFSCFMVNWFTFIPQQIKKTKIPFKHEEVKIGKNFCDYAE